MKVKNCHQCKKPVETAYRVQLQKKGPWIFVCKTCCEYQREINPQYRYGGTWKGYRH